MRVLLRKLKMTKLPLSHCFCKTKNEKPAHCSCAGFFLLNQHPKKILILGGTSEASELVALLAERPEFAVTLSLAGRTKAPVLPLTSPSPPAGEGWGGGDLPRTEQSPPLPNPPPQGGREFSHRIGGFGGAGGLANYLKEQKIDILICATHPFAAKMPWNALEAAKAADIPVLFVLRPEWKPQPDDNWTEVASHKQALSIIRHPSSVFLTVGRLELAEYSNDTKNFYLVRSIDEIAEKPIKNAKYITARPPFSVESELELMKSEKIDFLITKNSGGAATQAKLLAARALQIPVILIRRPARPPESKNTNHVASAKEAVQWLDNMSLVVSG